MRIAFHFPRLASGGVEKMRIVLARELLEQGFDVDFVLCESSGEYLDQVPAAVRIIDLKARRTLTSLRPLINYLNEVRPDRLVSSLGPQNVIAIIAARLSKAKTPVYVTQHNALSRQASKESIQQRLIPVLYRFLLPHADGVIAVSHGIARDMAQRCQYSLEKIHVIHNPAHIERTESSEPPTLPFGVNYYALAIGRLVEQKGYPDLLSAFASVAEAEEGLHLVILGNGPLLSSLKRLAEDLGISDRVHFLGFVSDPVPYLKKCAVFVLSSHYEGFGNVLVEALSVGAKVVSTRCDYGPDEILDNGRYGTLVTVGDTSALSNEIINAVRKDVIKEGLISRAREFSSRSVTNTYLRVLGFGS